MKLKVSSENLITRQFAIPDLITEGKEYLTKKPQDLKIMLNVNEIIPMYIDKYLTHVSRVII